MTDNDMSKVANVQVVAPPTCLLELGLVTGPDSKENE